MDIDDIINNSWSYRLDGKWYVACAECHLIIEADTRLGMIARFNRHCFSEHDLTLDNL